MKNLIIYILKNIVNHPDQISVEEKAETYNNRERKVFEIMGLSAEETEERFGHLIKAYEFGAPFHAGIAPGLDRLVMLLANEQDIREVIAFPMSSKGQTSVMEAPSPATKQQLKELHLKIEK